jgi:two-component system, LuxR family, sensor kinase FixL
MRNLNDSFLLLSGAFDLFPDSIIIVDKTGVIRNSNKQIEAIFGYTPEEVVGMDLAKLLPARFRQHHGNFVASFIESGKMRRMGTGALLMGLHKSGSEFNVDIALSVVDTGSEKYALAAIRDISDKMGLVNQLTQLEHIKNELEQFAYVLTHDLKAPLNKIKALTQLIELELPEEEGRDVRLMMNYINDSVSGMEQLIYGVLEYYRAKLAKTTVDEQVDLNETFAHAMHMLDVPSAFQVTLVRDLPVVLGNATMLLQVFLNLINNAISHNDKAAGILEIDWRKSDDGLEFTFSDNGVAVPHGQRDGIFELTTQLGKNINKNSHGLGLAIIKQVVEGSGNNRIWCDDSPLGGCCFKFTWSKY